MSVLFYFLLHSGQHGNKIEYLKKVKENKRKERKTTLTVMSAHPLHLQKLMFLSLSGVCTQTGQFMNLWRLLQNYNHKNKFDNLELYDFICYFYR